jgi:uncharacterized protein YqjF (DUF2071 family)
MGQRWETLSFLHWGYEEQAVQRLLPPGLRVETFDGRAWVGLVPFHMTVGPGPVRSMPWLGDFHETNVRTYVRDEHGRSGIWFFSLDAQRLAAVVAARAGYALPYFWSAMRLERRDDVVTYSSWRRWPGPKPAASRVVVEVGPPYRPDELTERDHFLTARWRLFSSGVRGLRHAEVEHPPWPLRRAAVREVKDDLVRRAGLPPPSGSPLVHYSEGVDVTAGVPRRV